MNKKNLSLYIGLAIPVLLLLVILAVSYLPNMLIKPDLKFVYSMGQDYYSLEKPYYVSDGKVTKTVSDPLNYVVGYQPIDVQTPQLFIYDAKTNQSRETSANELENMNVVDSEFSKDGYSLKQSETVNPILGGYVKGSLYLKKGLFSRKIELPTVDDRYDSSYNFVGWVE